MEDAHVAAALGSSCEHRQTELILIDSLRTAEREDDASRLDFPESNSIQTGVALQRIAECILMLGESRRVQHDEIIVVTSLLEEFERIFGKRLMTRIAREVEFCIGTGQVDGL